MASADCSTSATINSFGVEEPPDFPHARHQRPVHDVQRRRAFAALFLQIRDQSVARPFDDVVAQTLVEWQIRSACLFFFLCGSKVFGDCRDVILVDGRALFLLCFRQSAGTSRKSSAFE